MASYSMHTRNTMHEWMNANHMFGMLFFILELIELLVICDVPAERTLKKKISYALYAYICFTTQYTSYKNNLNKIFHVWNSFIYNETQ